MKVLVLLSVLAVVTARKPQQKVEAPSDWECGTGEISKWLTYSDVYFNCASEKSDKLNKCCINHDECFTRQSGYKECNNDFFDCLRNSIRVKEESNKCRETGHLFWRAVKHFGPTAYDNCSPNNPPNPNHMAGKTGIDYSHFMPESLFPEDL